jgi:hypothetical protein
MIRVTCVCGRQLQIPEEFAGQTGRCPYCGAHTSIPSRALVQHEEDQAEPPGDWPDRSDDPEPTPDHRLPTSDKAVWSLCLGIASLMCLVITALPAVIVGVMAFTDINRSRGRLGGRALAAAGIVAGALGILWTLTLGIIVSSQINLLSAPQARGRSSNNLRQMALAMNTYALTYDLEFPPAGGGRNMHPQLSWRVALLPFLEEEVLYRKFNLNEPWDGPNNLRLLGAMPSVYAMHDADAPGLTRYRVFVGPRAAFDLPRADGKTARGRRVRDFPAVGKTILIAEAADAVPWTKPDELEYDPDKPLPRLSRLSGAGAQVAMGDASVRFLDPQLSDWELRRMIERGTK